MFALFGTGLGPTLIGMLSDYFAGQAFGAGFTEACPGGRAPAGASELFQANCAQASASGMRTAFSVIVLAFPWAAIHFVIASFTLKRDLHGATA